MVRNVGALNKGSYEPGQLIVKHRSTPQAQSEIEERLGARVLERFDFGPRLQEGEAEFALWKVPPGMSVEAAAELFSRQPGVEYAEPNYTITLEEPVDENPPEPDESNSPLAVKPNDLDRRQWGLENTGQTRGKPGADIRVREAWSQTVGDRTNGPIVAVIDSGVDISHPDLLDNLWVNPGEIPGDGIDNDGNGVVDDVHGYNAYHDNVDLTDSKVHGTHVAGIVGAVGNNGLGITGVAQKARLMPIKIFGQTGHSNEATVLRALAYADRMGARITTNSWGGIESRAMRDAYAASPALHFASAGNSGRDNDLKPHFPGSYPIDNMVAVAATDHKDELPSFSSYGATTVHLAAPGEDIYSLLPGNRYRSFGGTSMATPHVAGTASLILTRYPQATNAQVKARLMESSDPLAALDHKTVSGGRLNAGSALEDDRVPPAVVDSLRLQSTPNEIAIVWTASGDDGTSGKARRMELRRSDQPLNSENWSQAATLKTPAPELAGTPQSMTERFPLSSEPRQVHYGVVVHDNVGNRSPLYQATTILPAAQQYFKDQVETQWEPEGTWARFQQPGGTFGWTDSPDGDYDYGSRQALTSPIFSLQGSQQTELKFRARTALAEGDTLRVQASSGTQGEWRNLKILKGHSEWTTHHLSLPDREDPGVRVRFLFQSDSFHNADGVQLSDIEVLGVPNSALSL